RGSHRENNVLRHVRGERTTGHGDQQRGKEREPTGRERDISATRPGVPASAQRRRRAQICGRCEHHRRAEQPVHEPWCGHVRARFARTANPTPTADSATPTPLQTKSYGSVSTP